MFFALLIHLVVYLAALFLQFRREVGAPSEVARGEGEEDLKAVDQKIVNLGHEFDQVMDKNQDIELMIMRLLPGRGRYSLAWR